MLGVHLGRSMAYGDGVILKKIKHEERLLSGKDPIMNAIFLLQHQCNDTLSAM